MVQIDFARRTLRMQLLLAGQSGTWAALRALQAAVRGAHGGLSETPVGKGRMLALTLRPESQGSREALRVGGMETEFVLVALSGPVLEHEASALVPPPDGVLYVTDWSAEGARGPRRREEARSRLRSSLRLRGLDPDALPFVDYWHDPSLRPPGIATPQAVQFCGAGPDRRGLLRAFSALAKLVLEKLDQRYCSCMFSPERVERFSDLLLEADLASGVTQAVLASHSRPAQT